jgi:hypothetical protein
MYLITIVVVGCCVGNVDSRIIFVILVGCCVGYITTTSRNIIPQDQNSVFYSSGKKHHLQGVQPWTENMGNEPVPNFELGVWEKSHLHTALSRPELQNANFITYC